MPLHRHLISGCTLLFITANLILWCVPLVILALLKLLLPALAARLDRAMQAIYRLAVGADDWWFSTVLGYRWNLPRADLDPDGIYLIIANHCSWTDIILIQSAISREGPIVKFLAKRQLIWIPVLGIIFWAFDFPVLARRARRRESEAERRADDRQRIVDACRILTRSAGALLSFAEGTRFSEQKRLTLSSRFEHLLPPRAGGFEALCNGLSGEAVEVVDMTLIYREPPDFWRFLSGMAQPPAMHIESTPLAAIRDPRAWLAEQWQIKDQRLANSLRGEQGN